MQKSIHDANALLLYKVGPVYCCSPTFPVENVIMPPHMSQPPGSTVAEPGMFKTPQGIVKAIDLRKRFGVEKDNWKIPGRIVIVEVEGGYVGAWVDEIIDVIHVPSKGWGDVPVCIPKEIFSRTLLLDDDIYLYADFEQICNCNEVGYLRQHIENINKANREKESKIQEDKKSLPSKDCTENEERVIDEKIINIESASPFDAGNFNQATSNEQAKSDNSVSELSAEPDQSIDAESKIKTDESVIDHKKYDYGKSASPEVPVYKSPVEQVLSGRKTSSKSESVFSSGNIDTALKSGTDNSVNKAHDVVQNKLTSSGRESEVDVSISVNKEIPIQARKNRDVESATNVYHKKENVLASSEKERLNNDGSSSVFLYAAVVSVALFAGVFSVYYMMPVPVDYTSSNKAKNSSVYEKKFTSKKESADSYSVAGISEAPESMSPEFSIENKVSTDKEKISEEVKNESAYHADIKKDNEGLVIVLSKDPNSSFEKNNIENEVGVSENEIVSKKDAVSIVDVSVDKPNMNQIFIEGEAVEISPVIVSQPDGEKDLGLHPVFIENKNTSLLHSGMVIHVVVKGDTLWHIAKRYINDPYKYPELARLSHIKNPDLIYPGDKVKIIYQNGSN